MHKVVLYNHSLGKTYQYPSGAIATPERIAEDFPAITLFPHYIETDEAEQTIMAVQNLSVARTFYDIDSALSNEEAIAVIETILNTPQMSTEVSAEERIASALEYQIVTSLPDVEEV